MLLDGSDRSLHFVDGQHRRQRLLLGAADLLEHVPVTWFGDGIEDLDAVVGDAQRTGCEVALVDQAEQILSDLLLGQLLGWRVIVASQFAFFSEVSILRAFGSAWPSAFSRR